MSSFKKYDLLLRKATLNDADMILEWRNAAENRRYSLDQKIINKEEHINWLTEVLNDNKIFLLIAESDKKPLGVVRYDITASTAMVSIYLKPGETGKGIGSAILQCGFDWLRKNVFAVNSVEAKILPNNTASIKAFEKVGFEQSYIVCKKVL